MVKLSVTTRNFFRRRNPPEFLWRVGGFMAIRCMNAWMRTLNLRFVRYAAEADPAATEYAGPAIFVFWHEYIPFPIYTRPNCRTAMLLSQHQDAEILSHIAHFAGMEAVRGSTSRGGTSALKSLIAHGQGLNLAITPDGPRGPRRKLAQGCVYLSSRLQIPIIPLGFGCDRPWRNKNSWDKFAIPRPFSRARAVLGPRIQVPANLEREEIEGHRLWVEQTLNQLTTIAEQWAAREINLPNSRPLYPDWPRSSATLSLAKNPNNDIPSAPVIKPFREAG